MHIVKNIRHKIGSATLVVVIFVLVVTMIGSDVGRCVMYLFSGGGGISLKNQIAQINGKRLALLDYNQHLEVAYRNLRYTKKSELTIQEKNRCKDLAWNHLIEDILYQNEVNKVGIEVGENELIDLVQGEHIDTGITASFKDPKTGEFDKEKLLERLRGLNEQEAQGWYAFEKELCKKREKEKLAHLMQNSHFTTTLQEAHKKNYSSIAYDVDYLRIPFDLIVPDLAVPTQKQMLDYMAAHSAQYKALESKKICYVYFPLTPSGQDNASFQDTLSQLTTAFSTTSDPFQFAEEHTDGEKSRCQLKCNTHDLPSHLAQHKHTLQRGMIIGPLVKNGIHTLYKVVDIGKSKNNDGHHYTIAVLEKRIDISDKTRDQLYKETCHLVGCIKKEVDLRDVAQKNKLTVHTSWIHPSDQSIGSHKDARELVRWAYNVPNIGAVSHLLEIENGYLLAIVTDQVHAGQLQPLETVYSQVYHKVMNQQKAKMIIDKLKFIREQAHTLEEIKKAYENDQVTLGSIHELQFEDESNKTHSLGNVSKLTGACFGLNMHVVSQPIIDESAVFLVLLKKKHENLIHENKTSLPDDRMKAIEKWMQSYFLNKAMQESAQIVDHRYKYL